MGRNVKKPVRRRGAKRQAERRGGRKKKRKGDKWYIGGMTLM